MTSSSTFTEKNVTTIPSDTIRNDITHQDEKHQKSTTRIEKKKEKKNTAFDLLDVTKSLGYQIHRKSGRNSWSKDDDKKLKKLINDTLINMNYNNGIDDIKTIQQSMSITKEIPWDLLATEFNATTNDNHNKKVTNKRTAKDLRKRWSGSLDPNLKKGKWTPEEDELLIKAYSKHGSHWLSVSMEIPGRTEDQCAKRYIEVLGPSSEGRLRDWTNEEDLSLISKVKKYGTKWRKISSEMEFRPSLTCRNRWRKIITLVIRNQASNEITQAVKENKSLNLDGISNDSKGNDSNKEERNRQDNLQNADRPITKINEKSMATTMEQVHSILPLKTNDKNQSDPDTAERINSNREGTPSTLFDIRHLHPLTELTSPLSNTNLNQINQPHNSNSRTDLISHQTSYTNNNSNHNIINSLANSAEHSQNINTNNNNVNDNAAFKTNGSIQTIPSNHYKTNPSSPSIKSNINTEMQWKFTLKDGRGLSISNGSIDTPELVKELIEQAKKYSLKISIHQHIHNHYGSQPVINNQNNIHTLKSNTTSSVPNLQLWENQNSTTNNNNNNNNNDNNTLNSHLFDLFGTKHTSANPHYHENNDTTTTLQNNNNTENAFLSKSPTFSPFGFDHKANLFSPPSFQQFPDLSQSNFNTDSNSNNVTNDHVNPVQHLAQQQDSTIISTTQVHFSSTNESNILDEAIEKSDKQSSVTSNATPGSTDSFSTPGSVPDVGPNRISHFNYLPPTLKPQLSSSDNVTRTADLNKLLNPSPSSNNSAHNSQTNEKRKKRKRKKSTSFNNSSSNTPSSVSTNNSTSTGIHLSYPTTNTNKKLKKNSEHMSDATLPKYSNSASINLEPSENSTTQRKTNATSSEFLEEDGVDFWESLRSLANVPTSNDSNSGNNG
ncbi:Bas1p NDAI_0E05090 [Naumovozyma dairenensis CBS 421]|uniref:Myb-like DNA-binding protein BAS1 n=1 Tax=Naumovozyma dairenensis (strain ATCC 10597 / BCRC 20456 / CBS 421 / NBRC 0211 / NRRL Y-12639) TaxID=1071378 RepID=G0WAQ3_NAUDC|nr:hypothetical protein NDAI_0E05090 [Naumovozyma dairenensis CBS 421]CCD25326.1 hypothetical protein NDAI_0E05090 [Naumovozyma dairenensis CBS 421]